MQRRVGWGLVCLALAAAGCSPEEADATDPTSTLEAPTTTADPTQTSPSTTAVATTSAVPSTTSAPPTSITPDTTTPDTTTTVDPSVEELVAEAELILERTEASWDAVVVAFADPTDEQAGADLADYFTGNQLAGWQGILEEYRVGGFRTVPRPEIEVFEADPLTLSFDLERGTATVQVCQVRSALVVRSAENSESSDRVVRDEVIEEIVEVRLERSDGSWRIASASEPDDRLARCPE